MTWDDHEAPDVDLPIGCLFGGGGDLFGKDVSGKSLKTLMFGYDGTKGVGYSFWPMPYWKHAKIDIINDSSVDLQPIELTVAVKSLQSQPYPQERCGYFGVKRTVDVSPDVAYYSRAFSQRGFGKVVGLMMYSEKFAMDGDEFTYIDGSRTPQIHGDGTEDDHNQGWGGNATQKPLWGGLINGYDGAYRLYLADSYLFNAQIRVSYEHSDHGGGKSGQKTDFIFWYYLCEAGFGNLTLTDALDVGDADSEQAHAYQIDGETWFGQTRSAYDTYEQGNPFPTTDHGRAFTKSSQFTVTLDPNNQGVRLRRRLNRNTANVQCATVTVDGKTIPDTPWYVCDLPTPASTAFADTDFEIPATYTKGKEKIRIEITHVKAEPSNANNEYLYHVYCYGKRKLPPLPCEPPAPAQTLDAMVIKDQGVRLTWTPGWTSSPENQVKRWRLERREFEVSEFQVVKELEGSELTCVDQTASPLKSYVYRLSGLNEVGASDTRDIISRIPVEGLRALGLEVGKPGAKALMDHIASIDLGNPYNPNPIADQDLVTTLALLGTDADPVLTALVSDPDLKQRIRAAMLVQGRGPGGDALRDALIAFMTDEKAERSVFQAARALATWPADPKIITGFQEFITTPLGFWVRDPAAQYLMRALPEDQKNAMLAKVAMVRDGQNHIATLVERGALTEVKSVVAGTKDRIQAGVIQTLCSTAIAGKKPELRTFAAEMGVVALHNRTADLYALGGIVNALKSLGADAAPVLPLLKAMKPEDLKDAAKPVADAITEIEAKLAAAEKK
jgi:hypothetical protein